MKRVQQKVLFSIGWTLVWVGLSVAEPVDPCFPSELRPASVEHWSRRPWVRIQQLEAEREQLLKKISVLPQHDPYFLSDHLGYHSLFEEAGPDGSYPSHELEVTLSRPNWLDSIALAPAFNPTQSDGVVYAFPKRFKIEVFNVETDGFEEVVNWMDEDFPDPGPYPIFFSGINRRVRQVRITVPQTEQEAGVAYFALGEIYLFQRRSGGHIGANIVNWGSPVVEVTATDSFAMPSLWDIQYLHDGVEGLGFPLSDEMVAAEDLMVVYEKEAAFLDKVQITLDLGQLRSIGRIDFWPATAPYLLALPSLGFRGNIGGIIA